MAANDQRGRKWSQPHSQCPLAWSQYGRKQPPAGPHNHDSDPVIGPLTWGFVARREGLEPPTARSVGCCTLSDWFAPVGSTLLTWGASSVASAPVRADRIVWMIIGMIRVGTTEHQTQNLVL